MKRFVDIRQPDKLIPRPLAFEDKPSLIGRLFKFGILGIFTIAVGYTVYLFISKDDSIISAKQVYEDLKEVSANISSLHTDSTGNLLDKIDKNLAVLENRTELLSLAPILNEIPKTIGLIGDISKKIAAINSAIVRVKTEGLGQIVQLSDERASFDFAEVLADMLENMVALRDLSKEIKATAAKFSLVSEEFEGEYRLLSSNLDQAIELLEAIVPILRSKEERSFLVMFQNPTEIRPSGGFTGSYGVLTVKEGRIQKIEVNDIYYPVHFSAFKKIPPIQLQSITTRWTVQDANWFFDFRTSAKKFTEFMEASSVYKDKKISFDGVIALNVHIVEDWLEITGPIEIPEYGLTLNSQNFLPQVQKEVEEGRDKKPGHNPKKVLTFIMPKMLNALADLPDEGKIQFLNMLRDRMVNKDIQFYFRDAILENLVMRYGISGDVYSLPNNFSGDYLAVVNANIAGGKSDKFIKQAIVLNSAITASGQISNELTITRSHSGKNERDWWYRKDNQNYIKIFAPPGLVFNSIHGNSEKTITPAINYGRSGYKVDADLNLVERTKRLIEKARTSTYRESGKDVIATWFTVKAGETKDLVIDYTNSRALDLTPGMKFEFILDKQSGVESSFEYTLEAPPGYLWKESNDPMFTYSNDKLPGRLILSLTLEERGAEI